ncbi:MAG: hypothetical protein ABEL97_05495, partial [Salinibacter sp.]
IQGKESPNLYIDPQHLVLDCGTGECYRTAKDACDNNGDCKLLCDVLDVAGGQCTLSIAAACFIYNNT